MYVKDGESSDYGIPEENAYAWGWLGNKVESSGWIDQSKKKAVIDTLKGVTIDYRCSMTRGWHNCEICGEALGNAEIKISSNGKIFVSPSAVDHYIEAHDYRPDDSVVEAVINGRILKEEDLTPDFDLDMPEGEWKGERAKKLALALEMGMDENRKF